MPIQKPTAAGIKESFPMLSDCSSAGSSRLHIEAATITPAANPVSARCICLFNVFRRKNTQAEPSDVPANGIKSPCAIEAIIIYHPFLFYNYTYL